MSRGGDVVSPQIARYRFFGAWLGRYHAYCADDDGEPGGLELEQLCALFTAGASPGRAYALRLALASQPTRALPC